MKLSCPNLQPTNLQLNAWGEDTNYVQERAGRRYRVVERRFAMFPRESGALEIPPASLKLVVPDPDLSLIHI